MPTGNHGFMARACGGIAALAFCALAAAQAYPAKPIRLIVPSGAGGAYDVVLRAMAPFLQEELGEPWVVENRAGGGGIIGLEAVARAEPDGYMLVNGGVSQLVLNPLFVAKTPYDVDKDFTHIAMMGELVMALYVHKSIGVRDMKGLIEYAKANPGKVAYGSSGVGMSFHLAGEMLALRTGTLLTHVPYKGTAQALQDFFAGRLAMMFYPPAKPIMTNIQSGTIIPIAAMYEKRLSFLPDVPTMAEVGVGDLGVSGWSGISGPAGLPRPIVQRLNQAINKAMVRPEMDKAYESFTMQRPVVTPEQMTERIHREIEFWRAMIKKLGINPQF
jgi:tripartite-type tricarboxylate transporter receptor subunit TctC